MPRYFKNDLTSGGNGESHYGVIGDKEDPSTGKYPYGRVALDHVKASETANNFYSIHTTSTELFNHSPETMQVSMMYAHRAVRPHMMTVMALAMQDHPHAKIVAASTLSGFSSRLAQNAHKHGLLQPHRSNLDMASETGMDEDHDFNQLTSREGFTDEILGERGYNSATEISHSEVMAGRQFLKQMLRPTPEPAPAPVAEHPRFPGM